MFGALLPVRPWVIQPPIHQRHRVGIYQIAAPIASETGLVEDLVPEAHRVIGPKDWVGAERARRHLLAADIQRRSRCGHFLHDNENRFGPPN